MQATTLIKIGVVLAALAIGAPSSALQSSLTPAPAANNDCIKLLPGSPASPTYPEELNAALVSGTVRVELEFTHPERSPRVMRKRTRGSRRPPSRPAHGAP